MCYSILHGVRRILVQNTGLNEIEQTVYLQGLLGTLAVTICSVPHRKKQVNSLSQQLVSSEHL